MDTIIEEMLIKRLDHIRQRIGWYNCVQITAYAKGCAWGKITGLLGERHFLELLMEKIKDVRNEKTTVVRTER